MHLLLAITTPDAYAVDDVALLRLVPQTTSLVGARRARGAVDNIQLAVLPAAVKTEMGMVSKIKG